METNKTDYFFVALSYIIVLCLGMAIAFGIDHNREREPQGKVFQDRPRETKAELVTLEDSVHYFEDGM